MIRAEGVLANLERALQQLAGTVVPLLLAQHFCFPREACRFGCLSRSRSICGEQPRDGDASRERTREHGRVPSLVLALLRSQAIHDATLGSLAKRSRERCPRGGIERGQPGEKHSGGPAPRHNDPPSRPRKNPPSGNRHWSTASQLMPSSWPTSFEGDWSTNK